MFINSAPVVFEKSGLPTGSDLNWSVQLQKLATVDV